MSFQFRLHSVLKLRQQQRDVERQSVALAKLVHAENVAKQSELTSIRRAAIDELRVCNDGDAWKADWVASRQRHAEQLQEALVLAEAAVAEAESQLQWKLKRLVASNQAVRVLEQLCERQYSEFQKRVCHQNLIA